MVDPLSETWQPEQVTLMEALRDWAVRFAELNQYMAARLGLPTADSNALGQIVWAAEAHDPLTPARLARRIGMTSGATTALVDRLESAALITRSREHADRRLVTLRPTPAARERVREFTAAAGTEVAGVLREVNSNDLAVAGAVLNRMTDAVIAANERLHRDRAGR